MEADFIPYDGRPYLFASYCHDDQETVKSIIDALRRAGYAVTYDGDIPPGANWLDWVGNCVSHCKGLFAFVSQNFADSRECKSEIQYAYHAEKLILPIFLNDNVKLDPGIKMCLGHAQRICYCGDPDHVVKKLENHPALASCRHLETAPPSPPPPPPIPSPPPQPSQPSPFQPIPKLRKYLLLTLAVVIAIVAGALTGRYFFGKPESAFDDGVLIVSKGTTLNGKLKYSDPFLDVKNKNLPPWLEQRDDIQIAYINNGISNVCQGMFESCANLQEVHILGKITSIEDYAFYECKNLLKITVPDALAVPGAAENITNVAAIPKGVTSIGAYAFYQCEKIERITIPDSVTSIGDAAFLNCRALRSVFIPDSVETIGIQAFYGCTELTFASVPASLNTDDVFIDERIVSRRE